MAYEGAPRQPIRPNNTLKETIELTRRHLVREQYGHDGEHIREPFDSLVEKNSITLDVLKNWSELPIEMYGTHLPDGRFVIGTGSPHTAGYDWTREARLDVVDQLPFYKRILAGLFPQMSPITQAGRMVYERAWDPQEFTMHNHPRGENTFMSRILRRLPSAGDLYHSRKSKSKVDVILSDSHIMFYKAPPNAPDFDPNEYARERPFEDAIEILQHKGVYIREVPLDAKDPAFQHTLSFLQGAISWEETQKLLGTVTPAVPPR